MGLITVRVGVTLTPLLFLGFFSSYWITYQLGYESFCVILYFVLSCLVVVS